MLHYLWFSIFCIIFDKIYGMFGHGVTSVFMSYMFLYPLLGGALPFFLLWFFVPRPDGTVHYRLLYNCYNSGIVTLTVGSMLRGIFEIAGTSSPYSIVFSACGWAMLLAGSVPYCLELFSEVQYRENQ